MTKFLKFFIILVFIFGSACSKKNSKLDPNRPISAEEKRRQNIEQGRGASLKGSRRK